MMVCTLFRSMAGPVVVAVAAAMLAACGGGGSPGPEPMPSVAHLGMAPPPADSLAGGIRLDTPGPMFPESMVGPAAAAQAFPKALRQAQSAVDAGYEVDATSREAVRLFYKSVFASSVGIASGWTGTIAGCGAGDTSAAFKDATARRINWFRAMAGVPASVQFDAGFNAKAQQAAMLMSANAQLSHFPPSTWTCYNATAAEAAGKSNLALGHVGAEAISNGYMREPGAGNAAVGHRRWILYPQTQFMGTGDAGTTGSTAAPLANAVWVLDANYGRTRPTVRDDFVAWPVKGYTPYTVVFPRWSFSYPNADFSTATVTMTENGAALPTRLETVTNGFGENTLVWLPGAYTDNMAWARPGADTVYQVTVGNVKVGGVTRSFTYSATVFDPEQPADEVATSTITGSSSITSGQVNTYTFAAATGATSYRWRAATLAAYTLNDGAEAGTGNFAVASSAGYSVTTSDAVASGASAFHLAHTQPVDQTLQLLGAFVGSPTASLSFKSRLGLASMGQVARVEVSRDDGKTWLSVFEQAGQESGTSSSMGERDFSSKQVSLAQFADKAILLRFRYAGPNGSYYPQSGPGAGWYIDDIQLAGVDAVSATGPATEIATNNLGFAATQPGTVLLEIQPGMYGQYAEWSLSKRIHVSGSPVPVDQTFTSTPGNDAFSGGGGTDAVVFAGSRAHYTLTRTASGWSIGSISDGVDTIQAIERLRFSDRKLALDLSPTERAGQALQFIGLMAPSLVNAPSVVGTILAVFDQGKSMLEVCQLALDVGLVDSIAGAGTNAALAAMAYRNVVGVEPDAAAIDMLVAYMDGRSASYSQAAFMAVVAGLELNQAHIGLVQLQQSGVEYE